MEDDSLNGDLFNFALYLSSCLVLNFFKCSNDNHVQLLKNSPYVTIRDLKHKSFKKDEFVICSGIVKNEEEEWSPGLISRKMEDDHYIVNVKCTKVCDSSEDTFVEKLLQRTNILNVPCFNEFNLRRGVEKFNNPSWFVSNIFVPNKLLNGDKVTFEVQYKSERDFFFDNLTLGTKRVLIDYYKNKCKHQSHLSKFFGIFAALYFFKIIKKIFGILISTRKEQSIKPQVCCICNMNQVNLISLDCNHFTYCYSCYRFYKSSDSCPICNTFINNYLLIKNN